MINAFLRLAARSVHGLMKAGWFVRRPRTLGAHAVALTPQGRLVLVRLRYAPGWRLPGGGRGADETAIEAGLRELAEEIGMTGHGEAVLACELEEEIDWKKDLASIVLVRDVEYQPKRWSFEIEQVGDFALDDLPKDLSPQTRRWVREAKVLLDQ